MAQSEDRIVLAIECGHCRQVSGVRMYNDALYIVRCEVCGQRFQAVENLLSQYTSYTDRITGHERLRQALQKSWEAIREALKQWGRKAGREALARALSREGIVDTESDDR